MAGSQLKLLCVTGVKMHRPKIRRATGGDQDLLLRWRNDPLIRQNFANSAAVSDQEHQAWFQQTILSGASLCFIGYYEVSELVENFGYCRFDRIGDSSLEVSVAIDPAFQSKGLASWLLDESAREAASSMMDVTHFEASILPENVKSLKLFERAGFQESRLASGGRLSKEILR
jgi:RimJ/RimL family protein N-acetyltransferase